MIEMNEDEIREKLKQAKDAEDQKEMEKKETISQANERRKNLEKEMMDEIAKWEAVLPKGPEIIDSEPFARSSGFSYFLLKRKGENKIQVLIKSGETIKTVQDIDYFKETFAASDEMLEMLRGRIPNFIKYLSTLVD